MLGYATDERKRGSVSVLFPTYEVRSSIPLGDFDKRVVVSCRSVSDATS